MPPTDSVYRHPRAVQARDDLCRRCVSWTYDRVAVSDQALHSGYPPMGPPMYLSVASLRLSQVALMTEDWDTAPAIRRTPPRAHARSAVRRHPRTDQPIAGAGSAAHHPRGNHRRGDRRPRLGFAGRPRPHRRSTRTPDQPDSTRHLRRSRARSRRHADPVTAHQARPAGLGGDHGVVAGVSDRSSAAGRRWRRPAVGVLAERHQRRL